MLNDPNFRKNLLVSIITSILVLIFIEPLLKISANGIMWLGENISASFTKSVYTSAALGFREKFSFLHLLFFFAVMVGLVVGIESAKVIRARKISTMQLINSRSGKNFFYSLRTNFSGDNY